MKKLPLFALLTSAVLLASCGSQSAPEVGGENAGENIETVFSEFPAINPEAKPEVSGYEEGEEYVDQSDEDATEDTTAEDTLSAQAVNSWPVLKEGARNSNVRTLQYLLDNYGIPTAVDGDFGPNTEAAVERFQKEKGLTTDGIVGENTWTKLVPVLRRGHKGYGYASGVKAVQERLGLKQDGDFGPNTEAAVKRFQKEKGLRADGIVGENTWRALIGNSNSARHVIGDATRRDMINRAADWVNRGIPYSQKRYRDGYRTDCSGMVSMAWKLRDSRGRKLSATTLTLWNHAHKINVNDLQPGDVLNNRSKGQYQKGNYHVIIFGGWTNKANKEFIAYEQQGGRTQRAVKRHYKLRWTNSGWRVQNANSRSYFTSRTWEALRKNGM